MKNINELSKEELYQELLVADDMINYYTEIKKLALENAINGETYEGFLLKSKSSPRKISDSNKLIELAKSFNIEEVELYEMSLLSVTKLEKQFKQNKEFVKQLNEIIDETKQVYSLVKE